MKFSTSIAAKYLDSKEVRNRMADMHCDFFREKYALGEEIILPEHIQKLYKYLGLYDMLLENPYPHSWSKEVADVLLYEPRRLFLDIDEVQVYVIRKTVQEICSKINVKEERKFDYLQKMSEGHKILVLDENSFLKYYKEKISPDLAFLE